jgi:hypothetical protein
MISRMLYLSKNILPVLILAVTSANLLVEFGLVKKIAFVIRPLIRFSRLPEEAGLSIITYMASASAGAAMLAGFRERRITSDNETAVASILSNFFSFLNHLFIYYAPIVIPILGLTAGLLYVGSRFFISLSVTLVAATAGHFFLKSKVEGEIEEKPEEDIRNSEQKIKDALKASFRVFKRIIPRLVIIYLITSYARAMGWFDVFKSFQLPAGLPGETSTIIAVGFADTTSGIILAGSMIVEGLLSPLEGVIALLLASVVSMSIIFFRHSLPGKIAYFGARLGLRIAIITSVLDLIFTILVIGILLTFLTQ